MLDHPNTAISPVSEDPRKGSLGTYAKYGSAFDPETGEVLNGIKAFDPVGHRLNRFAMQSAARRILPGSRTSKCLRVRSSRPGSDGVEVWRSVEHKAAHYRGLQTCASVWCCPVCASKISERRRVELASAIEAHKSGGGTVGFLTLTNPHNHGDVLADVLDAQARALNSFWKDRQSRKLFASVGCLGSIRALEVTQGRKRAKSNGWHPHYHIVLFLAPGVDLRRLQADLYARWLVACRRAGLGDPSERRGVTLQDGEWAAEYASKWGLDQEMTKGHIKTAGKQSDQKGETPFDLLRAYLADPDDKQAAALFREYAAAFKGKRQLHWSRGLKALFAVGEVSDEVIAERVDDESVRLGSIDFEDWRKVVAMDLRGDVLELARYGWEGVERLLQQLSK